MEEINQSSVSYFFMKCYKMEKIKRNTIISDYSERGLRMLDLISFNNALKSTRAKEYLDRENHVKWKYLFDCQLQQYASSAVFRYNLNKQDSKFINTTDAFTTEILQIWSEISYQGNVGPTDHFLSLPLWHNSLIRIRVLYKWWELHSMISE